MMDSVVWTRYNNVTDTQTATSPKQMQRQVTVSEGNKTRNVANANIAFVGNAIWRMNFSYTVLCFTIIMSGIKQI